MKNICFIPASYKPSLSDKEIQEAEEKFMRLVYNDLYDGYTEIVFREIMSWKFEKEDI